MLVHDPLVNPPSCSFPSLPDVHLTLAMLQVEAYGCVKRLWMHLPLFLLSIPPSCEPDTDSPPCWAIWLCKESVCLPLLLASYPSQPPRTAVNLTLAKLLVEVYGCVKRLWKHLPLLASYPSQLWNWHWQPSMLGHMAVQGVCVSTTSCFLSLPAKDSCEPDPGNAPSWGIWLCKETVCLPLLASYPSHMWTWHW